MLTIRSNKTITAIQEEFNSAFPFLKLEFFKYPHTITGASPKRDLILSDIAIKRLGDKANGAAIQVSEDMSVTQLEQFFQDQFGISVQVFRKSGKSWLETTVTDYWTLRRQNDEGKELSGFIR